jgi:hypothetical protein
MEQERFPPQRHEDVGLGRRIRQASLEVPIESGSGGLVQRDQAALAEFRAPDDEPIGRDVVQSEVDGL